MGWGRTLLLGDFGTQMNVNDVERDVESIRQFLQTQATDHHSQEARMDALQKENHDLKLYVVTLIRLLADKKILSEADLNRFVDRVDPSDGPR
jgi:hypothetical protein